MPRQDHHHEKPVVLATPSGSIPCTFNKVWLRMTAQECVNVCAAYGLVPVPPTIGSGTGQIPSDLTAEGALAWMSWNDGDGQYYYDPDTPLHIASSANLTLWLDGKDTSSVLDASGLPIENGGKVATWKDKSNAGPVGGVPRDFTQLTSTQQPIWNGAGYLSFNGGTGSTSQLLACAATMDNFLGIHGNTIVVVVNLFSGGGYIFNDTSANHAITYGGGLFFAFMHAGGATAFAQIAGSTSVPTTVTFWRTVAPALELSLNGGPTASGSTTGNVDNLTGSVAAIPGFTADNKEQCNIYEVLIFNADIGSDRDAIGQYLQAKWGILWDNTVSTSINALQYRSGLFDDANRAPVRAVQVRQALESIFDNDPSGFLFRACGDDEARRRELLADIAPGASQLMTARIPTQLLMWNAAIDNMGVDNSYYGKLTTVYPGIDGRSNLVRMQPAYFGQNGSGFAGYDQTYVSQVLALLPAGRRWLQLSGGMPLWSKPDATNSRYGMFDQELNGPYRRGLSAEDWWTFEKNPSNTNLLKFLIDIQAVSGFTGLDGLVTDVERVPTLGGLQQGALSSPDVAGLPTNADGSSIQFRVQVTTIGGTTINTYPTANNFSMGDRVAFYSTLGPSNIPSNLDGMTLYYVVAASATSIEVSATSGGSAISPGTTFSGTLYVLRESLLHCMQDAAWTAVTANLPAGIQGLLKPVLDNSVWQQYQQITTNIGEVRFLFDTAMFQYYAGYMNQLFGLLRGVMPSLKTMDYDTAYRAGHDYYSQFTHEYGAGVNPGMLAVSLYGDISTGTFAQRWNWQSYTAEVEPSTDTAVQQQWAAFSMQLMRLRRVTAAAGSGAQVVPWMTAETHPFNKMGTTGLWSELVMHCVLNCDGYLGFYQSADAFPSMTDSQIADGQKKMVDCVAEADGALSYNSTRDPGLTVDPYSGALSNPHDNYFSPGSGNPFATSILYSRAFAGNRWVWRVTPNPNVSTTVTQTSYGVRFDNSIGYLYIDGGRINPTSQSALAPLGYWVEQPLELE